MSSRTADLRCLIRFTRQFFCASDWKFWNTSSLYSCLPLCPLLHFFDFVLHTIWQTLSTDKKRKRDNRRELSDLVALFCFFPSPSLDDNSFTLKRRIKEKGVSDVYRDKDCNWQTRANLQNSHRRWKRLQKSIVKDAHWPERLCELAGKRIKSRGFSTESNPRTFQMIRFALGLWLVTKTHWHRYLLFKVRNRSAE